MGVIVVPNHVERWPGDPALPLRVLSQGVPPPGSATAEGSGLENPMAPTKIDFSMAELSFKNDLFMLWDCKWIS